MGEPEYIYIAAAMLDIDPHEMQTTHTDLYEKLNRIDALCRKYREGHLVSRQAIAVIVDDWQVRQFAKPGSPG